MFLFCCSLFPTQERQIGPRPPALLFPLNILLYKGSEVDSKVDKSTHGPTLPGLNPYSAGYGANYVDFGK